MRSSRSTLRSAACAALLAGFWLALPGAAQPTPRAEPAQILVLGTFHFANPGLDVVQTDVADVLSTGKQAEIRHVVEALTRFRPTKIAVEQLPSDAPRLDSLYRAFRAGRHALARNETEQLGFRLAARFAHPRVHPIDHRGDFPFHAVMEYAQSHDPAFVAFVQDALAQITDEENRRQRETTIAKNLRLRNDPAQLARDHAFYLRFAPVGAGETYVGADLLARWYERNLRIFANVRRLAAPGDRIVVIIGSGHAPILRELIAADPGLTLVEALPYLPPH